MYMNSQRIRSIKIWYSFVNRFYYLNWIMLQYHQEFALFFSLYLKFNIPISLLFMSNVVRHIRTFTIKKIFAIEVAHKASINRIHTNGDESIWFSLYWIRSFSKNLCRVIGFIHHFPSKICNRKFQLSKTWAWEYNRIEWWEFKDFRKSKRHFVSPPTRIKFKNKTWDEMSNKKTLTYIQSTNIKKSE